MGTAPCTDEDNDGVCLEDDCDDSDPSIPATVGADCDDGDPNTTNDVIQADGCSCLGTTGGPADCTVIIAVGGPSQIVISNLVAAGEEINIIGAPTNWQNILICDEDCNNTEIITDLSPGTYSVKINNYGDDGSYCYFAIDVEVTDGPCPDEDEDGLCASEDCDDNNTNLPADVGSPCDDNDTNTFNDVIQADGCSCMGLALCPNGDMPIAPGTICDDEDTNTENDIIQEDGCTCLGTIPCTDIDGDGICVADDCDDTDASIPAPIGTTCDDGDALTENDVIQTDGCTCAGTIPSTDPDCEDVQVTIQGNTMQITGITAPIAIIKVFTEDYSSMLLNCVNNCGTSQTITDLTPQTYHLDIQFYTSSWDQICEKVMDIDYSAFQSIANSRNRSINGNEPFSLYPNPTKDQIFITVPKAFKNKVLQLQIITPLGQTAMRHIINTNDRFNSSIKMRSLNKGIYFLQILEAGKMIFVEKVVVE